MSAMQSISRREFFQKLSVKAQPAISPESIIPDPAPSPSLAAHVAMRLMFGARPGDVALIDAQGVDNWIAEQLNPGGTDYPELTTALAALPHATLSENTTTLFDRRSLAYQEQIRPAVEVRHATLARMLYSKWQLNELMVEFWHNHFNVFAFDNPIMCLFPEWDRLIRTHALGNFRQFLGAVAEHPVMLHYLDNYLSTNAGPNENYARELMELHTLGSINYNVTGGYTDEDVYECSRCFTGWTYERSAAAAGRGTFKYIRENHDRYQKEFLGVDIPRDQPDLADGKKVLDIVCEHQGTAYHIALKLCRRFVSETPSESLVQSTANVFYTNRSSNQQIALTLAHIFASSEFRNPADFAGKFKRPYDWMISSMRALSVPYIYKPEPDGFDMYYMMSELGHRIFEWRSPDGPPDTFAHWATANSLLRRYNYIFQTDAGWWEGDGLTFPTANLMPISLRTAREICAWWAERIIQRPISVSSMEGLMVFVAEGRNLDIPLPPDQIIEKLPHLAALCTVSPEFMWR